MMWDFSKVGAQSHMEQVTTMQIFLIVMVVSMLALIGLIGSWVHHATWLLRNYNERLTELEKHEL